MKEGLLLTILFSILILSMGVFVSGETITCVESDGGINYNIQSSTTLYGLEFSDKCVIKKGEEYITESNCESRIDYCIIAEKENYGSLVEWYCDSEGNREVTTYNCPISCINGACSTQKWICTDTDKGQYPNEAGSVYGYENVYPVPVNQQPVTKYDKCISSNKVREWNCEGDGRRIGYFDYYCPDGCSDGRCLGGEGSATIPPNIEEIPEDTHPYIIRSNFGSIIYQGMEEGATADTIDFLSTLFPNFVDGAFARYYIGDILDNKDLGISVAEFEEDISFEEFEENYVSLFRENSPETILNYDVVGIDDRALVLSAETTSTLRDGSEKTEVSVIWVSENKFILINIGDKSSIWSENELGGTTTKSEFLDFFEAYQSKHPSTLIPPIGSNPEKEDNDICNFGCKLENTCVSAGYRYNGEYCGLYNEFIPQFEGSAQCNNSFECGSNLCISGQCLEQSFIQKILNFFRTIFGNQGNNNN